MQRKERCVKIVNGVQADVEAVDDLSLVFGVGITFTNPLILETYSDGLLNNATGGSQFAASA
jgi:hypothetical protein